MTVTQMKEICKKFSKSLDDKKMDEWYATERDFWDGMSKKFIMWLNNNRKLLEEKK